LKIDVGTYVRILGGYTDDAKISGQTGVIEALPSKDYPDDYLVKLDGRPLKTFILLDGWLGSHLNTYKLQTQLGGYGDLHLAYLHQTARF
jgi:hypothetical protein